MWSESLYGHPVNNGPMEPLPERDWPTWIQVVKEYPHLCMEEQEWVLESLIMAIHKRRSDEVVNPHPHSD